MITQRLLAGISLAGVLLDLMGGLCLAYDLLGGGTLTREGARGVIFGLEIGFVVAAVGAVVATVSPFVEWWADMLPARRLGVFGALLVLLGFALQSLQYWATLLNVPVH